MVAAVAGFDALSGEPKKGLRHAGDGRILDPGHEQRLVARRAQNGYRGRRSKQDVEHVLRRQVVCRPKGRLRKFSSRRRYERDYPSTDTSSKEGQRTETKGWSFHLGFPIWLLACDQRGLVFRILTPLCMVARIFHRLAVSMLCFSCSEAQQTNSDVARQPDTLFERLPSQKMSSFSVFGLTHSFSACCYKNARSENRFSILRSGFATVQIVFATLNLQFTSQSASSANQSALSASRFASSASRSVWSASLRTAWTTLRVSSAGLQTSWTSLQVSSASR